MLSVSILGLKDQLDRINEINSLNIEYVHLDIMDGLFVPDTFLIDESVVGKIKKALDIHLMVKDPTNYIAYYSKYKPKYITIHAEIPNVLLYLNVIKDKKIGAGVAISPNTDLSILNNILPYVDLILVMSVEPGKGGQKFIGSTINRIKKIKSMCKSINPNIVIEVDGGINPKNLSNCKNAGADIFVVGSYITSSNSYSEVVEELNKIIKEK